MPRQITPRQLLLRLSMYFAVLVGSGVLIGFVRPELLSVLPIGGTDAIEIAHLELESRTHSSPIGDEITSTRLASPVTPKQAGLITLFLAVSLAMTVLVMLPITWTYKATKYESGFRKTFVRALIVLPICATTIVLLIQDSLALAFGLAALVAAVRFRVALQDSIDGIYIFAAICVGLAAGIGYLGIATVMAIFFCFASAVLWLVDYGQNPLDVAREAKVREKLARKVE